MAHTLSVALCTFNCAPYVGEQLTSLLSQTRRPDELVVGDEASTDGTREILEAFARRAPFPVRLLLNPRRLGVAANFTQVIATCEGSLIALCDHDDVWEADRLSRSEQAFADPTVALSFSDATLIDERGVPQPSTLWRMLGLNERLQRAMAGPDAFKLQLARRLVTGGTMTLRADVAQWALPIPAGFFQDEWLALLAAMRGRLAPIPTPLMRYRQHPSNSVGARDDGWLARVRRVRDGRRAERLEAQLSQLRLLQAEAGQKAGIAVGHLTALEERIAHVAARLDVRGNILRRGTRLLRELRSGRYRGDAMGYWSAVQDLVG